MMERRLRIAMIGQKSVPARFGGIETHVEQLSTRLAARGHDVSVYCRTRFRPGPAELAATDGFEDTPRGLTYKNVHLLYRPSIDTKHLDAATHAFVCASESVVRRVYDVVHFHGIGPSAFAPLARLSGAAVFTTVHALDWRQAKWGSSAKRIMRRGEAAGIHGGHGVIGVSNILVDYVRTRYGVTARYIPNGASIVLPRPPESILAYGLQGGDYILSVGRIIRDRGLHHLLEAYRGVETSTKLVIVGSEYPRTGYSDELFAMADDRVIFTGDLFGDVLEELYSNCRFYVLASEVEGLPITPCEAMSFGRCVLLSDIPENKEVGGDVAVFFNTGDINDLHLRLNDLLESRDEVATRGEAGRRRVESHFNWDSIAETLEAYYLEVLAKKGGGTSA
jgi:glycosyltransferase involved in cell wall biosynthesis